MRGAVLVAIAAAFGNFLQGWDNATIAGAVIYIKREFKLENEPTIEGLIVAISLIGATIITTFSGAVSDSLGRRPMLVISSILYFSSALLMLWSPNVYLLLLARLIYGLAIGLAVTLVPVYISETAPSEIRGLLNTLPQFMGSGGMFLSYCMVFAMSLQVQPDWRLMLGVLSIPSLVYVASALYFLPESPRWLVSKGRMVEAKQVLQRLRGRQDVSEEMAVLVEGLQVSTETSIEEYIISPANDLPGEVDAAAAKDKIVLYGTEHGHSFVAKPVTGQSLIGSTVGLGSRMGSLVHRGSFVDPVVTLFGSIHEKLPETGSMRSALLPNFGSMLSVAENQRTENWDEENATKEIEEYTSDGGESSDDNLRSPLLSPQATETEVKGGIKHHDSLLQGKLNEGVSSTGIGGGWHLAYKETVGTDGTKNVQRVYLHEEGLLVSRKASVLSVNGAEQGDCIHAAALASQLAPGSIYNLGKQPSGAPVAPSPVVTSRGTQWSDLFQPGVKFALFVGVGIQILQQFSGINGVLYYTPQILSQAGVDVILSNLGLSSDSASILISALTTFLMLPCITVAMRLMDVSGRRSLLQITLPILIGSLILLILSNVVSMPPMAHAVLCTASVIVYICCFVMGFGPIPNIICSEIFPTQVRGVCIAICGLTFWFGDIIVTYTLPLLLNTIGLTGVFGIYAIVCAIALAFVVCVIPETKGMPLEVIIELFNLRAKHFGLVS